MTDAAGPPGPAERFSSLPIREADTATMAGAKRSELIIRCDMAYGFGTGVWQRHLAQTFDIPRQTGQPPTDALPREPLPRQAFRIASQPARSRPDRQIGIWVSLWPHASAPNATGDTRRRGRFPVPAILSRLINSGGFDKTTPVPV